jgi:hypothetical protein
MVDVETRLKASEAPDVIDSFVEPPQNPVHVLCRDDALEFNISRCFRQAFGADLIVKRAGGKKTSIHVGLRQGFGDSPDRASPQYLQKLLGYPELGVMGHGMRSFGGCLLNVFAAPAFVLLIDEPEVFLHPPHARILGTILAREKPSDRQIVFSTHSTDILQGILDFEDGKVQIVRMTRGIDGNHAHELKSETIRQLWNDPLLRFSNVFDGLFHDLVVVCEGDADCRFYSAVLTTIQSDSERRPDVLFTWTNGKHRLSASVTGTARGSTIIRS